MSARHPWDDPFTRSAEIERRAHDAIRRADELLARLHLTTPPEEANE